MTTVGRAGEVWFLSMVNWIEYEPFGAKKKRAATVESLIDGHPVKKSFHELRDVILESKGLYLFIYLFSHS